PHRKAGRFAVGQFRCVRQAAQRNDLPTGSQQGEVVMSSTPILRAEKAQIIRRRLARLRCLLVVPDLPKTKRVLDAERTLNEWEARNDAIQEAAREKHRLKVVEVENALLLDDMEKVVELLDKHGV